MDIQAFIFNWNGQSENTILLESIINNSINDVRVINSDDKLTLEKWINIGNSAYFSEQFRTALNLFDGEIFMHVQGDVKYSNWDLLIRDAIKFMRLYEAGIYAPNIDYTWYSSERADINSIIFCHNRLKMVSTTDETVWFIHKSVLERLRLCLEYFAGNKFGWGWDLVIAALSFEIGKPVIRDYEHTVFHPKGTGYSDHTARDEMFQLFNRLEPKRRALISRMIGDEDSRNTICEYF